MPHLRVLIRQQVVDWNNGRAGRLMGVLLYVFALYTDHGPALVVGENESEIMKMIGQIPK